MKSVKSLQFVALYAFIVLLSCKKEIKLKIDEPKPKIEVPIPNTEEPIPEKEEPVVPTPIEEGIYIPIKLEANAVIMNLNYKSNSTLLTEILDSDRNKTIITYNATGHPQSLEKYKDGKQLSIDYFFQNDQKITNKVTAYIFNNSNLSIPNGNCIFIYNKQLKISSVNYMDTKQKLIKTSDLQYNESSNLTKISTSSPVNIITYTYDQKKGISSNISFSDVFALQFEHWFLRCIKNNVLTKLDEDNAKDNIDIKYEYNDNGYPSIATLTQAKNKQTIKITYKRLEP